jgi:hypothetical protein
MTATTTSTTRRVRSIGIVVTLGLLASGCAAGEREAAASPAEPVRAYLEAIAAGDARTAISLDDLALRITSSSPDELDLETLRTDDVLGGAVERISAVEVADPGTTSRREPVDVGYRYELAGEERSGELTVAWDSRAQEWQLQEALSGRVAVQASAEGEATAPIGFTVPGATAEAPEAGVTLAYVAYPAVYDVTAEPAGAPGESGMTRATVVPAGQLTLIDFVVSSLPDAR